MSAAMAAVAAIATPTSAPAMLLNEILMSSSIQKGAFDAQGFAPKASVCELQADAHDVQILLVAVDISEHALVHMHDVVVEHEADVAVQVPVERDGHDALAPTEHAAGKRVVPVEIGVAVPDRHLPGAPGVARERERPRRHRPVESADFVVERARRVC